MAIILTSSWPIHRKMDRKIRIKPKAVDVAEIIRTWVPFNILRKEIPSPMKRKPLRPIRVDDIRISGGALLILESLPSLNKSPLEAFWMR